MFPTSFLKFYFYSQVIISPILTELLSSKGNSNSPFLTCRLLIELMTPNNFSFLNTFLFHSPFYPLPNLFHSPQPSYQTTIRGQNRKYIIYTHNGHYMYLSHITNPATCCTRYQCRVYINNTYYLHWAYVIK